MRLSAFNDAIKRFRLENVWLKEHFLAAAAISRDDEFARFSAEMAVIRLHDAWSRYCRELVVVSALGRVQTLGGVYLSPGLQATNRRQVIHAAVTTTSGKVRWVKWGVATECIDTATRLRIANLNTVATALGATNTASEEVRTVRNFFAHRSRGAREMAVNTNRFPLLRRPNVWELAIGGPPASGLGLTTFEIWIDNLEATAEAAAQ
jgi:hypothetical protein